MESKMENVFKEFKVFLQQIVHKYPEEEKFISGDYNRIHNKYNLPQSMEDEMEVIESQNEVSF